MYKRPDTCSHCVLHVCSNNTTINGTNAVLPRCRTYIYRLHIHTRVYLDLHAYKQHIFSTQNHIKIQNKTSKCNASILQPTQIQELGPLVLYARDSAQKQWNSGFSFLTYNTSNVFFLILEVNVFVVIEPFMDEDSW